MKKFTIKSGTPDTSLLELINETEGGYFVRIVHRHVDWDDVKEDFLPRELFDTCSHGVYRRAVGLIMDETIEKLKLYFSSRADVSFALLFGSRSSGMARRESDWDVAAYFRGEGKSLDIENPDCCFPVEQQVWGDVKRYAAASVDLIVLNRAPATLAAAAIYEGSILSCADVDAYQRFSLAATLLAEDERDFAVDYVKIKARSRSLSEIDHDRLLQKFWISSNRSSPTRALSTR